MIECNIVHSAQTAENNLWIVYWVSHQLAGNVESSLEVTTHQNHSKTHHRISLMVQSLCRALSTRFSGSNVKDTRYLPSLLNYDSAYKLDGYNVAI